MNNLLLTSDSSLVLPATVKSLPLGIFWLLLALACFASITAAQTRLNSSQVVPLNGDAQGSFAHTRLRDLNSAADHGNGTTNGIASAINDCGVLVTCSILVPPSYGVAEPVPGYRLTINSPVQTATTPGNIGIFDHRYSDARMFVNYYGYPSGQTMTPTGWLYNYYLPYPQNAQLSSLLLRQSSLDGGSNLSNPALNYLNKTTWSSIQGIDISHTPGQHESMLLYGQTSSLGNVLPISNIVHCSGGLTASGDQGCAAQSDLISEGTVEYSGALTGTPSTGATSLTVAPVQGANTQGAGRFLARTSSGLITGGTITQISSAGPNATVTGAGTAWPVSTVVATLGTNVNVPGAATVTPASFSVGSITGIATNSLVCVSDGESFEMLYPSSVTSTTFTAAFAKAHPANAIIAVGGLCGYLMDLTADDVTNATFPTKSQTITGTLHFAWPIAASTSATSAYIWVAGGGGYQQIVTRWNANSANGYVLYPFAEVTSVQQNGGISNNLTLSPNKVNWTAGDTVSEFLYPSHHYTAGNNLFEAYYPSVGGNAGLNLTYNVPLQGNEAMLSLINNLAPSFYSAHGGSYFPPAGLHVVGPTTQAFTLDRPGDQASIAINCKSPCNGYASIAAGNAAYYDFLYYEEGNKHWSLTANAAGAHYYLAPNGFYTPFFNIYLTEDSTSHGYINLQQLRSNTAANTDLTGEVTFSAATSVTQQLAGRYQSHPECIARPQFDAGANTRHWITYSANSFTINFSAPVTGLASYSCFARN